MMSAFLSQILAPSYPLHIPSEGTGAGEGEGAMTQLYQGSRVLNRETALGSPGGPNVITRVIIRERHQLQRERCRLLKEDEEAISEGMQAAPRNGKDQEMDFPLEHPEGTEPC